MYFTHVKLLLKLISRIRHNNKHILAVVLKKNTFNSFVNYETHRCIIVTLGKYKCGKFILYV